MSKQRFSNLPSLSRTCPDVSSVRVTASDQTPTSFALSVTFLAYCFLLFFSLTPTPDHRDSFRHSKLLCLYTSAIVPSFLFSASCYCYFCYSPFRHSLLAFPFVSNLVSQFPFASFVPASRSPVYNFFLHPPTSSVASFATPSFPRSLFFIFTSHLPLSALYESAFPPALFTSFALFHASFPPSSVCVPLPRFIPLFFNPPAATFSNFSRCFAVPDLL